MLTAPYRKMLQILCALVLLIVAGGRAGAQSTQGSIVGTVQDPTGAAVSGAAVQLINVDTSVVTTTHADNAGEYVVNNLPPGQYRVHVDAPGFKSTEVEHLLLTARQQLRADVSVQPGSVSEQVTVDASSAGVIETETASISASLDSADVRNLPANYRASSSGTSPLNLIQTLPGVQTDTAPNNGTGGGFSCRADFPFKPR